MAGNRFRLQGGLGNQLFIYYAAANYAIVNKQEFITFDAGGLSQAKTERVLELDNFELPIKYEISVSRLPRLIRAIFTRINRILPAISRTLGYLQPIDVGFNSALLKGKYFEVSGYFQSWRYPEQVKEAFPDHFLVTKTSSDWAESRISAARDLQPILCHIRRGDFLDLQNSFGVLSYEYYLNAINILRSRGVKGPVWVMTDSPTEISLKFLEEADAELIIEPANTQAAETFAVMQACSSFIISNSTFSWWAAFSSNARNVIAPEPWFKSLEEPMDLIPDNWIRIQSRWV
jgi:Glycosyl transferase family 11